MSTKILLLITVTLVTILTASLVVSAQTAGFSDIDGHWAERIIVEMAELGIVEGYPDGTYRPDDNVTRAEATAMVERVRDDIETTGEQGERGPRGPAGDSAYEIAVAQGFEGTRQAWLASLQGEQGPTGPQGSEGQQGARGPSDVYTVAELNSDVQLSEFGAVAVLDDLPAGAYLVTARASVSADSAAQRVYCSLRPTANAPTRIARGYVWLEAEPGSVNHGVMALHGAGQVESGAIHFLCDQIGTAPSFTFTHISVTATRVETLHVQEELQP